MKKLLVTAIALMFALPAFAIDWHTGSKIPITWNKVAKIKDTDKISYVVYTKNVTTEDEKIFTETDLLESEVDVGGLEEGPYYLGVSAKRVTADNTVVESDINWSDENGEDTPNPFGVRFYAKPGIPSGLSIK